VPTRRALLTRDDHQQTDGEGTDPPGQGRAGEETHIGYLEQAA
jgi:hypothetical protein